MKRIAFFGPLPPLKTGIADYNHALLPWLRKDYEIDVFLPFSTPSSSEGFPHGDFFLRQKRIPYDLALYHMGNQPRFHEYMYGYLFQQPGAVLFHDYCLHHSRADMLLKRNMTDEYREELRSVYPDQAERIANATITFAAGDLLFFHYPLFELIVRASLALGVHTDAAVKKLQICETPVIKIPCLQMEGGTTTETGIYPGKMVVASFGYATQAKRISTILETIADLCGEQENLLYVIVGALEDRTGVLRQIEKLGLKESVLVTGHVEMEEFLKWISRADIVLNLRYPSAGEMSSTLIRALASGKPVIISRLLDVEEIPENAVLRVRPDHEKEDLKAALTALLQDLNLRDRLSANARKYIEEHHTPQKAREKYQVLVETALKRKSSFVSPELPLHLRSGAEILKQHLLKTTFERTDPKILEWLP
ncbi:glycosyltransferase family 4 protein [bacterium]|nr:glycosyltransferase family 4 protein [bacterium]MCI0603269.1 glycosyltransferase family 4 protein [bacterium]